MTPSYWTGSYIQAWSSPEYGMVPRTFYEDGDAIDAMVVMSEPTFTGCIIEVRPIGLLRMRDENGADDKVLCVAVKDPRNREYHDLADLPTHYLDEIAEFFRTYKHLEEGKNTEVLGWEGRVRYQYPGRYGAVQKSLKNFLGLTFNTPFKVSFSTLDGIGEWLPSLEWTIIRQKWIANRPDEFRR